MEHDELLRALRSTAADQHRCFGCGYEYKCSIRGCAINRAAAELIAQLAAENEALRHPPSDPLTLEELREMDGEPVWVEFPKCPEASGWMLVFTSRHCVYDGLLGDCDFENCGKNWLAYRRRPEEGTTCEKGILREAGVGRQGRMSDGQSQ